MTDSIDTWNILATPAENDRTCKNCKWSTYPHGKLFCIEPDQWEDYPEWYLNQDHADFTCSGSKSSNLRLAKWQFKGVDIDDDE